MIKSLVLPTILSLGAGLSAQTFNVLPKVAATANPGGWASDVFYGSSSISESHTQVLYDAGDVQSSGVVLSMQVRRPAGLGNANVAATFHLKIDMSTSPVHHLSASPTYAMNHGPTPVTVFNGPISLPAQTNAAWPRPWEAPFTFSTPFPVIMGTGASLCVEFTTSANSSTQPWYVEGTNAITGSGTHATNLGASACPHSGGVTQNSLSYSAPTIGQNFSVTWQNVPENNTSWQANACLFGLQGAGGTFGGMALPIRLSAIGLPPTTPNCQLANDILATAPLTYATSATINRGSLRLAPVRLPNDPSLGNAVFFTQAVALDQNPTTQAIGVWTSWGSKWTVGDAIRRGEPVTTVSRTGANTAPTGTIVTHSGPTIRLNM